MTAPSLSTTDLKLSSATLALSTSGSASFRACAIGPTSWGGRDAWAGSGVSDGRLGPGYGVDLLGGYEAEPFVQLGERDEVSVDQVDHRLYDRESLLRAKEGHHAKVDVSELARPGDQEVARVRVGVVEAVLEHLAERALYKRVHQRRRLEPHPAERIPVRQPHTVDPTHREHAARAEFADDLGRGHVGYARVEAAEAAAVGRLDGIVDLRVDQRAKVVDYRDEVDVATERTDHPREHGAVAAQDVQVECDGLLAARPLHLDSNGRAVGERRLVHLAERRRRHRRRLYLGEDLARGYAKLALDDAERFVVGERRHAVLQPLELFEVLGGE